MERIIEEIRAERKRQDGKWGLQNHGPLLWLPILMEEVGEASQAALDSHNFKTTSYDQEKLKHYREEMIQVAAVALAMVECLDRQNGNQS